MIVEAGEIVITPEYFEPIEEGWSKFLISTETDPLFSVDQIWTLKEWNSETDELTGRWIKIKITHVVRGTFHWAIDNSTSAFSFVKISRGTKTHL